MSRRRTLGTKKKIALLVSAGGSGGGGAPGETFEPRRTGSWTSDSARRSRWLAMAKARLRHCRRAHQQRDLLLRTESSPARHGRLLRGGGAYAAMYGMPNEVIQWLQKSLK